MTVDVVYVRTRC